MFEQLGAKVQRLLDFSSVGSGFVFGPLGDRAQWESITVGALGEAGKAYAVIFAFQMLPTIIFIAALFAILYYLGVMQIIVRLFAVAMNRVMGAVRRGITQRGRQHFHGPDRGAADHPPVPLAHDAIGADDGDDVGAWRTFPAASWRCTSRSASTPSICSPR